MCTINKSAHTKKSLETYCVLLVLIKTTEIRDEMLFREIWYEEYLLDFRENCKDLQETNYLEKIKMDDVVLIKNPVKTRLYRQLGRVTELFHEEDNKIFSVNVKRVDGLTQKHSINLYQSELTLTHDYHPLSLEPDNFDSIKTTFSPSLRPKE